MEGPQRVAKPARFYTREALMAEGFPLTTIRWYQRIGLLPKAEGGRGRNAMYTDIHISILREIRRAKDENRNLTDLRDWADHRYPHKKRKSLSEAVKIAREERKDIGREV